MATPLTRPLVRIIGNLHLKVTETHVEIRRLRHKRGVRVALSELIGAADGVRPPRGWVPRTGELVAVLPSRRRARVTSVIPAVPEALVGIHFRHGTDRIVELSRLVPVDGERIVVQCERTPSSGCRESDATLFSPGA